ncbi:hypothetical protein [Lacticaseibacillus absianus]|uniref:hypothetical protein n=1 Tax=Lacticaseibacillus absianus TaxID=2729623 RepID=UPI0015CCDAF6|nr:hypothetical protein [Lacticaseibacillus absianus]
MPTRQERHHQPAPPNHLRLIVGAVALSVIAVTVGFALGQNTTPEPTPVKVSSRAKRPVAAHPDKPSAATNSPASSTAAANATTTITDGARLAQYNGVYGSDTRSYALDLAAGTFNRQDGDANDTYRVTQILQHADHSLVVNLQGLRTTQPSTLSLLIAPAGTKITRNWQVQAPLQDHSDANMTRLAIARSHDGGRTFDMTPAYQAFADEILVTPSDADPFSVLFTPED